jgi:hypothetical protein
MLAVVDEARVLAGEAHAAWSESFNEMFAQAAGAFANAAVRRHGQPYLLGLLSQTERKNGWTLAEFAGDVSPDGLQPHRQRRDLQRPCCHELRNRWSLGVRLLGVPLPCQKQPTMKDNREHSGDIRTPSELSTRSSRARWRQPDKDEVGDSSPLGPPRSQPPTLGVRATDGSR